MQDVIENLLSPHHLCICSLIVNHIHKCHSFRTLYKWEPWQWRTVKTGENGCKPQSNKGWGWVGELQVIASNNRWRHWNWWQGQRACTQRAQWIKVSNEMQLQICTRVARSTAKWMQMSAPERKRNENNVWKPVHKRSMYKCMYKHNMHKREEPMLGASGFVARSRTSRLFYKLRVHDIHTPYRRNTTRQLVLCHNTSCV